MLVPARFAIVPEIAALLAHGNPPSRSARYPTIVMARWPVVRALVVVHFPPMIRYQATPEAGRGVFATRTIEIGAVIERVPVIVIPESERPHIDKTILDSYAFDWEGRTLAIVLGLGSIYNHSLAPNARYFRRFETREMEFVALAPIEQGEEVLINYNGDPADQTAVLFHGDRWRFDGE